MLEDAQIRIAVKEEVEKIMEMLKLVNGFHYLGETDQHSKYQKKLFA